MANLVRRGSESGLAASYGWDPLRLMRDMMSWDPFREIAPSLAGREISGFVPDFDVKETKDAYVFKADLPGVKEKDLEITVTGNRLTVSGKREAEEREEGENYFTFERSYGSFSRTFTLPEGVDGDAIDAKLEGGVLTLRAPKRPEVQPKRISIGEKIKAALGGKEKEKASA